MSDEQEVKDFVKLVSQSIAEDSEFLSKVTGILASDPLFLRSMSAAIIAQVNKDDLEAKKNGIFTDRFFAYLKDVEEITVRHASEPKKTTIDDEIILYHDVLVQYNSEGVLDHVMLEREPGSAVAIYAKMLTSDLENHVVIRNQLERFDNIIRQEHHDTTDRYYILTYKRIDIDLNATDSE